MSCVRLSRVAEATAAAHAAAYVSAAPPGAVNVPVDDILERVMFDRSRYSLGKSFTPEKADLISRYARKLQDDYAKTVRAGLIADEPTEAIANKVARVRVISREGPSQSRHLCQQGAHEPAHRPDRQIEKRLDYIWVMDPATRQPKRLFGNRARANHRDVRGGPNEQAKIRRTSASRGATFANKLQHR